MNGSESVPTVLIKTESGPTRINLSDYDQSKHGPVISPETEKKVVTLKLIEGQTPVNGYYLAKSNKKFVVVDAEGVPVKIEGIDADGYKTDTDAFGAMSLIQPAA